MEECCIDIDHEGTGALNRSPAMKRASMSEESTCNRTSGTSGRRRSEKESEIDCAQLLESLERGCNAGDRVARMRNDARGKMQPVVAETADRLSFPVVAEIVTLQQLDEREGQQPNREVETVGGELSAREMIEIVVMFEFADEPLHLSALVVKMNDRVCGFFVFRKIGGNNPVAIVAVEEIRLVAVSFAFNN